MSSSQSDEDVYTEEYSFLDSLNFLNLLKRVDITMKELLEDIEELQNNLRLDSAITEKDRIRGEKIMDYFLDRLKKMNDLVNQKI